VKGLGGVGEFFEAMQSKQDAVAPTVLVGETNGRMMRLAEKLGFRYAEEGFREETVEVPLDEDMVVIADTQTAQENVTALLPRITRIAQRSSRAQNPMEE
jgi:hypothetical protein